MQAIENIGVGKKVTNPPLISIKVAAIQRLIDDLARATEIREPIRVLKKQVKAYEKYEGCPEMATARNNVAHAILSAVRQLRTAA